MIQWIRSIDSTFIDDDIVTSSSSNIDSRPTNLVDEISTRVRSSVAVVVTTTRHHRRYVVVGVVNVDGASIVDHRRVVGVPVVTLPRLFLAQYSFRVRPVIQIVEALCTK